MAGKLLGMVLLTLVLLFLVRVQGLAEDKKIVLIAGGKTYCVVVLGGQPTPAAKMAAEELTSYLKQISGAEVPLVAEGEAGKLKEKILIFVGDSALAREKGIESSQVGPEGIIIQTGPGYLALAGSDQSKSGKALNGTKWAVYTFLEELGVRWLWPGPLGTVVPKQKTIAINPLDIRYTPRVVQRRIRNTFHSERLQKGLDRLGWTKEDYLAWGAKDAAAWFEHQKLGCSLTVVSYSHSFGHWWEKYGQAHPEYFALQPDGSRSRGGRARLCKSNPEVIRLAAQERIEFFDKNPSAEMASISLNDGGETFFCACSNCTAWDVPERGTVQWGNFTVPHMSDRVWRFYSETANLVAKKYPDKLLGAYAYSAYEEPPLRIEKVPENIAVGFAPTWDPCRVGMGPRESQKLWDGWHKKTKYLFLRPNNIYGNNSLPLVIGPQEAGEVLKHCINTGCIITDFDTVSHTWAIKGIDIYVTAKLLWDSSLDVNQLINDYCRAGFGEAAKIIRRLFDDVESRSKKILSAICQAKKEGKAVPLYQELYQEEDWKRWADYLRKAESLVQGAEERERIQFFRTKLQHSRILADWHDAQALKKDNKISEEDFRQREQKLIDFYKEAGMTWAVASSYLRYHGM